MSGKPKFTGKVMWTPETGWTDNGPTVTRTARELNRDATTGYRDIMSLIRMSDQEYGTPVGMCFALAETAYVFTGEIFPGFGPSPLHVIGDVDTLDRDSYPDGMVIDWYEAGSLTIEDMRAAFTVLSRWADWFRLAGQDY